MIKGKIDKLQEKAGEEVGGTLANTLQTLPSSILERTAWVTYMKGGAAANMLNVAKSLKVAHASAKADAVALGHEAPATPTIVSEMSAHMLCFNIFSFQMKLEHMVKIEHVSLRFSTVHNCGIMK